MAEMETNLRLEALWGVTTLAMYDPEFRSAAVSDLESALWMHGFALSPLEMDVVRDFRGKVAGMSDAELVEELRRQPDIVSQRGRWC
jgi:hypothetical protein